MKLDDCELNKPLWNKIRNEVTELAIQEPTLASFLYSTVLSHRTLEDAVSYHLANKLDSATIPAIQIREIIYQAITADNTVIQRIRTDIIAVYDRDPACDRYCTPFLFFKGLHALQGYRISHWLWMQDRKFLALFFQSQISTVFGVDIHPAAILGSGIMIDHASNIVVGETAIIGDNVSIMQSVTLGGTGKKKGNRHPKIEDGVLISTGAKILGNIVVGEGSKVGAGSVVLSDVKPYSTVVGVPAKAIGKPKTVTPSHQMDHTL